MLSQFMQYIKDGVMDNIVSCPNSYVEILALNVTVWRWGL